MDRTDGVPVSNGVSPTPASVPQREGFVGYLNTPEGKERFPKGRFPKKRKRSFIVTEYARYWVEAESKDKAMAKFLGPNGICMGLDITEVSVDERWIEEEGER